MPLLADNLKADLHSTNNGDFRHVGRHKVLVFQLKDEGKQVIFERD
jgi:hypothetical protein